MKRGLAIALMVSASVVVSAFGPDLANRTRRDYPPVLDFATNRNMVATNSFPTPSRRCGTSGTTCSSI